MPKIVNKPTTVTLELDIEEINHIVMALGCSNPSRFNYGLHELDKVSAQTHDDLYDFFISISESKVRDQS